MKDLTTELKELKELNDEIEMLRRGRSNYQYLNDVSQELLYRCKLKQFLKLVEEEVYGKNQQPS